MKTPPPTPPRAPSLSPDNRLTVTAVPMYYGHSRTLTNAMGEIEWKHRSPSPGLFKKNKSEEYNERYYQVRGVLLDRVLHTRRFDLKLDLTRYFRLRLRIYKHPSCSNIPYLSAWFVPVSFPQLLKTDNNFIDDWLFCISDFDDYFNRYSGASTSRLRTCWTPLFDIFSLGFIGECLS